MKKLLKKRYVILVLLFIILIGGVAVLLRNRLVPEKKVHYHAGFVVFQNNKKIDFSGFRYMNIVPCTLNKNDKSNENPQQEKAHLHDNVGDVIHIEHAGAIWKDLFTNIHYPIDYSKSRGFVNGIETTNYQTKAIKTDDSLVVFIGNNNIKKDLQQSPTKNYIEKMGNKSKTCGE